MRTSRVVQAFLVWTVVAVQASGCLTADDPPSSGATPPRPPALVFERTWTVAGQLDDVQAFPVLGATPVEVEVTPEGVLTSWSIDVRSAENGTSYYTERCQLESGCRIQRGPSPLPAGPKEAVVHATGEGTLRAVVRSTSEDADAARLRPAPEALFEGAAGLSGPTCTNKETFKPSVEL